MIRFNFLHPPFNNEKMRQALLYAVNQQDYVIGIAGDPKNGHPCYSYFTCGTPLASEIGAEPLKGKRDLEQGEAARSRKSGYKGEKIVIIDATDQPIVHSQSLLTLEMLKKLGLNAEMQAGDWGTLITRRAVEGAGREGRLVDLPHLARRARHGEPGGQLPDPRHRRQGVVRLADRREARGAARSLVQRDRCGRVEESGRRGAAARVRVRAVHPDRAVHPADGVSLEHLRRDHRADRRSCGTSRRSSTRVRRRRRDQRVRLCSPPARSRPSSSWRWSRSSSSRCCT